ncbi:MAG TPA: hypothetical protein V6C76_00440 [Drouetiella sp.]
MLSSQANPLRRVDPNKVYLSVLSDDAQPFVCDELAVARKRRDMRHLRRIQRTNFFGRAAIRIIDLFTKKEIA